MITPRHARRTALRVEDRPVPEQVAADGSASSYRRTGRLLGLSTPIRSELELAERLEQGLPVSAVQALRTRVGLTDEEIYRLVAPRRTLERRESGDRPLAADEADRVVRIARIAAHALEVFSASPGYALEWLRAPQPALRQRSPLQALASESGARAVEEILSGLEHGVFA